MNILPLFTLARSHKTTANVQSYSPISNQSKSIKKKRKFDEVELTFLLMFGELVFIGIFCLIITLVK